MGYSAVLRSHAPDAIDAFCNWIRGQPTSFEEIPLSSVDQIFRFKVRSRKRRTGIVCKKGHKFLLVGAAEFHFERFAATWGRSIPNGERQSG